MRRMAVTLAGLAATVVPLAHAQRPDASDVPGGLRGPTQPPVTASAADSVAGTAYQLMRDLDMYRGATDGNIVWHILATDSVHVAAARLALGRGSDPAVRRLARTLLEEHTQNTAYIQQLQAEEHIGVAPMATDPIVLAGGRALASLQRLAGAAFDSTYIRTQIIFYLAEGAAMRRMAEMARDDDLEDAVEHTLEPIVRRHLERARDAAQLIGLDARAYRIFP